MMQFNLSVSNKEPETFLFSGFQLKRRPLLLKHCTFPAAAAVVEKFKAHLKLIFVHMHVCVCVCEYSFIRVYEHVLVCV